jgi:hypothetical protein
VQANVAVEAWKPRLQLLHQRTGEPFRLGEGQLAELAAGAGHGAAPERRGGEVEVERLNLAYELVKALSRHVEDEQILHRRRP